MNEDENYFYVNEGDLEHMPEEFRLYFNKALEENEDVLNSVNAELNRTVRISRSLLVLDALRNILNRLTAHKFEPTLEYVWELEAQTTAFVMTYARLQQGGGGIGFNPKKLPDHLLEYHERLIELRNTRFAHDDPATDTLTTSLEVRLKDGGFELHPTFNLVVQVGGTPEWKELLDVVEALLIEHHDKMMAHLTRKTGRTWTLSKQAHPLAPLDQQEPI